ncbi:DUF4198 domain-containing protein [Oxalobacteraceae bacterium OM1]|nr:DUF4198 domain-containing protein [Oxalobacteraceae bacterium OM1]
MKRSVFLLGLLAAFFSAAAWAHEFWMESQPAVVQAGGSALLKLEVGEYFEGSQAGFSGTHTAAMRHYHGDETDDLVKRLPADGTLPVFGLPALQPGTHLIAYDSQPSLITLAPDKFHAYLHDEGLDAIIRQREASGTAALPGRERYRRNVKHLLRAGGQSDATYAVRAGQRLEIVPLSDPYAKRPGDTLAFQLLFDGRPLAGALVKAWHKRSGQTTLARVRTDQGGKAAVNLPYAGVWMLSVVHMIKAVDTKEADWDSFWGNLTFSLGGQAPAQ